MKENPVQTFKDSIKHHLPWLVPAVRNARWLGKRAVDALDSGLYQTTLRRGISISIRPGVRFKIHPSAWRRSFNAFAVGGCVEDELDAFIGQCKAGMQLVDVGASYGVFSLTAMAWPESRALLIEPHPQSVQMLRELRRMNGLSDQRFIVVPAAAGDRDGRLAMGGDDFYLVSPASQTSVPMRSLDSLCSELGYRPTHIKIDVEGFEFEVLKGAVTVLEQCMPVLHLEIHDAFLVDRGTDPSQIHEFLRDCGYDRVWSLVEKGADGGPSVTRTLWCPKRTGLQAEGTEDGARALRTRVPAESMSHAELRMRTSVLEDSLGAKQPN